MAYEALVVLAIGGFVLSWLLTRMLLRRGDWHRLLDHPNERSLHDEPTPRGGGIAIVAGLLAGGVASCILFGVEKELVVIGACVAVIAVVSFVDDLSHVHPGVRILVHFLAAGALVFTGLRLDALELPGVSWALPGALGSIVTAVFVVWLVNLYNFMDGMDGFAGGMAIIGFGTLGLLGALGGDLLYAGVATSVAAAAGGFLLFNFPPARIFMGDVGSSTLGFLSAALLLWADVADLFPLWIGVLVFSAFIVDATFTLLRRLVHGERIWRAHRTHCYQRLVQLGWGHRKTVLWEYVVMIACAVSAVVAMRLDAAGQWWVLSSWVVVYAILIACVYWLESRQRPREHFQSL